MSKDTGGMDHQPEPTPTRRQPLPHAGDHPSPAQRAWLERGQGQAGGKLPLFDHDGKRVSPLVIQACLDRGWAEPWFANPVKPDWLVCRLTEAGHAALARPPAPAKAKAKAKPRPRPR